MPLKELENVDEDLIEKRGEGKKYALLMAALELFGEYGYKGTSSRMIAGKADANIASIPYYFGGKEGLYHAVVQYIADRIALHSKNVSADILALIEKDQPGKQNALEACNILMSGLARTFVESDEPKAWAQVIIREQANPTAAFDIFYDSYIKETERMAARCIGLYTGLDPECDEVKIRFHTLIGQILSFVVSRESILRNLGVKTLKDKHISLIHRVLMTHMRACLDAPLITEEERIKP